MRGLEYEMCVLGVHKMVEGEGSQYLGEQRRDSKLGLVEVLGRGWESGVQMMVHLENLGPAAP